MAESVRELRGDPSYVLDCLAQRLAREGWTVVTRTGALLQASRDGSLLSLTVLGSFHGTRVHAEGSHSAVAYFRQAIDSEGTPPRDFPLTRRARHHLGAAIIAGLSLTATVSLLLLLAFCESPPPSDVTTGITGPAPAIANLAPTLAQPTHTSVPPSATPTPFQRAPALVGARAGRPQLQPTPLPAVPSFTPTPPEPTVTAVPPEATPTPSTTVPAKRSPTATAAPPRPSPKPVTPTPTLDLSRLADAPSH
jgi:hypothetical protein